MLCCGTNVLTCDCGGIYFQEIEKSIIYIIPINRHEWVYENIQNRSSDNGFSLCVSFGGGLISLACVRLTIDSPSMNARQQVIYQC